MIVCCYRGEKTIEACLESLANQESNGIQYEIIIVDDGSLDKTQNIIRDFLKKHSNLVNPIFKSFRKKNEGLSIARNFGIKLAKSEIISFIDEDAIADKYFIMNIVKVFNENKSTNCVGGKVALLNSENYFANILQDSIFTYYMNIKNTVIGTNMSFRKGFLAEIGYFHSEFTRRGDETALFAKSEGNISIIKSDIIVVYHEQPTRILQWIITRYENGYFLAGIDHLIRGVSLKTIRELLVSLALFIIPITIIILWITKIKVLIMPITVVYIYILLRKFIINKLIINVLKEYNNNRKIRYKKDILLIIFILIFGQFSHAYGFIRGFINFGKIRKTKSKKHFK